MSFTLSAGDSRSELAGEPVGCSGHVNDRAQTVPVRRIHHARRRVTGEISELLIRHALIR